jgi:hypothetical protein
MTDDTFTNAAPDNESDAGRRVTGGRVGRAGASSARVNSGRSAQVMNHERTPADPDATAHDRGELCRGSHSV